MQCTLNSSLDLLDLSNTIIFNLLVFVVLLLVFERMRHKKSVYFPRDEWCVALDLLLPALSPYPARMYVCCTHPFPPCPRTPNHRLRHRKPPELPRGFLRWVRPLMATPQEKILQLAGLDAFMLLRYIRLCLKVRPSVRPSFVDSPNRTASGLLLTLIHSPNDATPTNRSAWPRASSGW